MILETERLILNLLDECDELDIVRWRNKKEIIDSFFSYRGVTISNHRSWFESYSKDNTRLEYVISIKSTKSKIGTIGLSGIDHKNQKAEYGIMIAEESARSQGFAQEASIAIINYAFAELNLRKIKLNVFADNADAIKLYNKLRFQEEGILRQEIFKNSSYKDVIMMALFKKAWLNDA